jgi:hypothetical protein
MLEMTVSSKKVAAPFILVISRVEPVFTHGFFLGSLQNETLGNRGNG